jgi:hypothetical protein
VFPGATDVCDGADNNCDGAVDELGGEARLWYRDADADGYGDPNQGMAVCGTPEGYADNNWDCDDTRSSDPVWVAGERAGRVQEGTYTSPFATVQAGMDAAAACVYIEGGNYKERIDFRGKPLAVIGIHGAAATMLAAPDEDPGSVVRIDSGEDTAILVGVSISSGTGSCLTWYDEEAGYTNTSCTGGGVHVGDGAVLLSGVILEGNVLIPYALDERAHTVQGSYGAGLYVGPGAIAYVTDSLVADNDAYAGAGVFVDIGGELGMLRTAAWRNTADYGSVVTLNEATAALSNLLVQQNFDETAWGAVYAYRGSVLDLRNATFVENSAGVACGEGSVCAISSSIFVGGKSTLTDANGEWSLRYLDFWGNDLVDWSGFNWYAGGPVGMMEEDPLFVS